MTTNAISYLRSEYNPNTWRHLTDWPKPLVESSLKICLDITDRLTSQINSDKRGLELKKAVDTMFNSGRSKYTHFCNAQDFIFYLRSRVSLSTMMSIYKLFVVCDRVQALRRELVNRQVYTFVDLETPEAIIIREPPKTKAYSGKAKMTAKMTPRHVHRRDDSDSEDTDDD